MKVTIDFGDEITPAIQRHLESGIPVRNYVQAAVSLFETLLEEETKGNAVGYGDASRFKSYNTVVSPTAHLNRFKEI